jgi:hypothetical protein
MEKMRATTNGHNHQRMIEETDMEAKGGDIELMTIMVPTTKYLQGTKTIATKGTTIETQGTVATEAAGNFRQENPENTTHHHVTYTPRLSMGNEYPGMQ